MSSLFLRLGNLSANISSDKISAPSLSFPSFLDPYNVTVILLKVVLWVP